MLRGCLYSACIRSAVAIYAVATHWYVHVSCTCLVFFSVLYASTKRLQLNMYVFMCLKKQLFFCVCVCVTQWHVKFWPKYELITDIYKAFMLLSVFVSLCMCVCTHSLEGTHMKAHIRTWIHQSRWVDCRNWKEKPCLLLSGSASLQKCWL